MTTWKVKERPQLIGNYQGGQSDLHWETLTMRTMLCFSRQIGLEIHV